MAKPNTAKKPLTDDDETQVQSDPKPLPPQPQPPAEGVAQVFAIVKTGENKFTAMEGSVPVSMLRPLSFQGRIVGAGNWMTARGQLALEQTRRYLQPKPRGK